jgi:hypothetical protein
VPLAGHVPFWTTVRANVWLDGMNIRKNHYQTVALATLWRCFSFGITIPVHSTDILKQSLSTGPVADSSP